MSGISFIFLLSFSQNGICSVALSGPGSISAIYTWREKKKRPSKSAFQKKRITENPFFGKCDGCLALYMFSML
jgi:hypothetical protein